MVENKEHLEGFRVCGECGKKYYKKYGMSNARCSACISKTKYHRNKEYYQEYHKVWAANERREHYERVRQREKSYSSQRDLLKERYGITKENYKNLLDAQLGGCAICGGKNTFRNSSRDLFVDHDHETKKIRGLLCNHCNTGLGHFKDNRELLQKAIDYLKKHGK